MKRSTVVVVVAMFLWAATGCEDDEHFPPGEGGGPSGGGGSGQNDAGGGGADAGTSDANTGDAGPTLAGELCDVTDVRDPLACPNVDLNGIEVRAVDTSATDETDAQGNFRLSGEFDSDLLLSVGSKDDSTRLALVPVADWSPGGLRVPRVDLDIWDDLLGNLSTNEPDGTASIALYVVAQLDGLPVVGAVVSTVSDTVIFYDDGSSHRVEPDRRDRRLRGRPHPVGAAPRAARQVTVNDIDFRDPGPSGPPDLAPAIRV